MKEILIKTEYITLGQFLKYAEIVSDGIEAKIIIQDGLIKVNQEIEIRRGKKIRNGDIVSLKNESYLIINEN